MESFIFFFGSNEPEPESSRPLLVVDCAGGSESELVSPPRPYCRSIVALAVMVEKVELASWHLSGEYGDGEVDSRRPLTRGGDSLLGSQS